jgi:hypothetical protein
MICIYEKDITDLEKCVVLLQMLTFVGDDLYDDYIDFIQVNVTEKMQRIFYEQMLVL